MWGRAVDCVILLSLQEHLQRESNRYLPSALDSQIAGGLCVASMLIDFRTFKLRKSCGLLLLISLIISHDIADKWGYRHHALIVLYSYWLRQKTVFFYVIILTLMKIKGQKIMKMYRHTLPLAGLGYVRRDGNNPAYPADLHFVRTKGVVEKPIFDNIQAMVESISSTKVDFVIFYQGGYLFKEINN